MDDRYEREHQARRRRVLVLGCIAAALVAAPAWSGIRRLFAASAVPPELIGVWTTAAPGYEDRALEFTRHSVLLHSDQYHFTVHPLRRVWVERHRLYTTFHIEYQDVDGVTPLVFRFIRAPRPLIRLQHFPAVWQRPSRH